MGFFLRIWGVKRLQALLFFFLDFREESTEPRIRPHSELTRVGE